MKKQRVISSTVITFDGIKIKVIKKTSMKNLYLRVKQGSGEIVLTAPKVSDEYIMKFIEKNIDVLKKHIEDLKKRNLGTDKKYIDGETHFLWGRPYTLRILDSKKHLSKGDNEIFIYVKKADDSEEIKRKLNEYYREEIKIKLATFVDMAKNMTGVSPNEVRIKNMKTRWGSCNIRDRRVWVSLNLAKYDEICLLYILLHELTHLKEKNHTKRFYKILDETFSMRKECDEMLKIKL
ncbi:MAG: M48 family metallopeptidase [Ezakiella coagulans]|uniref:M48 family metallopeptidase n=1 Tax=Ezakiella coagulans TaxID=46507 RepID=UPI00399AC02E